MPPLSATNEFAITRPHILTLPLSLAREVTTCSLSPVALSKSPKRVLKNASSSSFIKSAITSDTISELVPSGRELASELFLKSVTAFRGMVRSELPSAIRRFIEYSPVITITPENKSLTFSFTFISPVASPASAPASIAPKRHITGFIPLRSMAVETTPPRGKVPSTLKSGKSSMLYVMYIPRASTPYISPCSMLDGTEFTNACKISMKFS